MTDLCPHCRGADDDCETCGGRGRLCPRLGAQRLSIWDAHLCGEALAKADAAYCPTCDDLKVQFEARMVVQRMLN